MAFRTLHNTRCAHQFIRKLSTETKLVSTTVNDKTGVATVNLQRPPVNSLNLELLSDISSTVTELGKNKCRGLILTSSSKSVFSAGLDILEMYKPDQERLKQFWTALQGTWIKLYGATYPTVAVVNGHAPAGGCLLALSCEYRIMSNGYTTGLNETLLGIVPPKWFISTMKNVIGHRQTELALTTGKLFQTEEALNVGLVDEVVESKEEGIAKAEAFIKKFAKISPLARSLTKQYVREKTIKDMKKDAENDLNTFVQFITNPQAQKSLEMYLEALKKKSAA